MGKTRLSVESLKSDCWTVAVEGQNERTSFASVEQWAECSRIAEAPVTVTVLSTAVAQPPANMQSNVWCMCTECMVQWMAKEEGNSSADGSTVQFAEQMESWQETQLVLEAKVVELQEHLQAQEEAAYEQGVIDYFREACRQ